MRAAFREGAERAGIGADIGVVDVAGYDIAHITPAPRLSQCVGGLAHIEHIAAAHAKQRFDRRLVEPFTGECGFDDLPDLRTDLRPIHRLVEILEQTGIGRGRATGHPATFASKPLGICASQNVAENGRVDPGTLEVDVARIDRKTLDEFLSRRRGHRRQLVEMRPRRFGIDVIRGNGRNPAPIVDARRDQLVQIAMRKIGRRLQADVPSEDEAGERDRSKEFLFAGLGRGRHPRSRLGAEVLDDHLLDIPVCCMDIPDLEKRIHPLFPCFADADQ